MNQLLALHPRWVRPDYAAGDLRLAALLGALEATGTVDLFLHSAFLPAEEERRQALRGYYRGKILFDRWRGTEAALYQRPYDCCLIEFWHLAEEVIPLIRRALPWAPIIVDSVDVHFVREAAASSLGLMDPQVVAENKRREIAVYEAADAVFVISEADAEELRAAGVTTPLHVVSIVVPMRPRTARVRPRELLFVGGFNHAPNQDGLLWFTRECWPLIRAQVPEARLTVVGSNPPAAVLELGQRPGIEIVGYAPETASYLDRAAVSVAPLRFGGGLKGKVCEALAAGIPLVTTSVGTQGLELPDGPGARVQDTAPGFAEAVVWALTHPAEAEAMGAAGHALIRGICDLPVVAEHARTAIRALQRAPSPTQRLFWKLRGVVFQAKAGLRQLTPSDAIRSVKKLFGR